MDLIQELVKQGIIEKEKAASLSYEIRTSGKKEEEMLLEKDIVSEDFLFELKSKKLKVPFEKNIPEKISADVLKLIPEESVKFYKMIPLTKKGNAATIGMVYPEDFKAREALKFLANQNKFSYKIYLITLTNFETLLKQYRPLRKEIGIALEKLESDFKVEKAEVLQVDKIEFKRLAEEAPIIKMVTVILRQAVEGMASDIHVEPGREKLRIRFRLDGILHSSIFLPLKVHPAIVARVKILSSLRIDETRIPQDGRFSAKINNKVIDFRVSTFPTSLGEKVVMRILDSTEGLKSSLQDIGLRGRNLKEVEEAIKKPYGMVLVTGPTGSGKTTTLYAVLQILNKEGVNIVTLEDPIEYFVEGISQSQVKPDIGYNFASGLRHILRQDPDIIMVGEIRDEETASLAIHAALTGHIVLSTLHTSDAFGAIPRFVDMKVEPFLIPATLNIVVGQRLVRCLCPHCKKRVKPSKEAAQFILKEINSLPSSAKQEVKISSPLFIYKAKGCKKCNFKGLLGRIGIFEVLKMTDSLADLILGEFSKSKIREEAKKQGMVSMKQDGILKAMEGITSIEEVIRVAEE